jgi:hypothetical protein
MWHQIIWRNCVTWTYLGDSDGVDQRNGAVSELELCEALPLPLHHVKALRHRHDPPLHRDVPAPTHPT